MRTRRLVVAALVWLAAIGTGRALALPERCPPVDAASTRAAATAAVGWLTANQLPDGRWVYRYYRNTGAIDLRPHTIRQSGDVLALYQAAGAGIDGALETGDRGAAWSLTHVLRHDDWEAVDLDDDVPTGTSALLAAALAARVDSTGDTAHARDAMQRLGRFLVAMVEPDGSVSQGWDVAHDRPLPPGGEQFHSGETFFALASLAAVDPEGPWLEPARRVGHYLATDRDRNEGRFPPSSDHWSAYTLARLSTAGVQLDATERAFADRLADVFGIQVRGESQRTGSGVCNAIIRGRQAIPAGLGSLGEGLAAIGRIPDTDPAIPARVRSAAGMIVARQAGPGDVPPAADPVHVVGAWFHANGMTQMDDQQHPLAALLVAQPSLGEPNPGQPVGGSSAPRLAWLALVALAAVNPFHASGLTRTTPRRPRRLGAVASLAAGVFVAAIAGPLLRAIDVSPPTAAVAAGLILAVYGVADAVRPVPPPIDPGRVPWLVPVAFPALLRAGAVLVVLTVAAAHGVAEGILTASAFLVAGLVPAPSDRIAPSLARVAAAIAIIGAIDLVLHGVFAV